MIEGSATFGYRLIASHPLEFHAVDAWSPAEADRLRSVLSNLPRNRNRRADRGYPSIVGASHNQHHVLQPRTVRNERILRLAGKRLGDLAHGPQLALAPAKMLEQELQAILLRPSTSGEQLGVLRSHDDNGPEVIARIGDLRDSATVRHGI